MKKALKITATAISLLAFIACNQENKSPHGTKTIIERKPTKGRVEKALQKEQINALKPDDIVKMLEEGNIRFTNNNLTARDHSKLIRNSMLSQYPKAIVLSCTDSRVLVEDVFDRGIGDLFVARVAGNFVNEDILESMEYAYKVSGSKLILVMGHEHCNAVKAAIDDVKLGNITPMFLKIRPAVNSVEYTGERNSKNQDFVYKVCKNNVMNTVHQIRLNSPILKEMEDNGELKIVGALYDMDNGKVDWLN